MKFPSANGTGSASLAVRWIPVASSGARPLWEADDCSYPLNSNHKPNTERGLLAKLELLGESLVPIGIGHMQVIQQPTPLADHFQ